MCIITKKHTIKNVLVIIIYLHTAFKSKNNSKTDLQIFPPSKGTMGIIFTIAKNTLISAKLLYLVFLKIRYKHILHAGPAINSNIFLKKVILSISASKLNPNNVIFTLLNLIFKITAEIKWAASWAASAIIMSIYILFIHIKQLRWIYRFTVFPHFYIKKHILLIKRTDNIYF